MQTSRYNKAHTEINDSIELEDDYQTATAIKKKRRRESLSATSFHTRPKSICSAKSTPTQLSNSTTKLRPYCLSRNSAGRKSVGGQSSKDETRTVRS